MLRRAIPGTKWEDALGCYPLSLIDPEGDLKAGLERLRAAGLVSVALVPDPVTGPTLQALRGAFPIYRRFKTHYLIDRALPARRISATHRRWIRKALRECQVSIVSLSDSLGEWERLYQGTIKRRAITGLQKFSSAYFAALAGMPEVEAFAAQVRGKTVAMALWVHSPDVSYYHLGASDERGYESQAMYGIFAAAQEHFSDVRILHLGGAAGVTPGEKDGLGRFKAGFANREVDAYFCGACLNPERYAALSKGRESASFFPAYREP